jgi:hypothetical protein
MRMHRRPKRDEGPRNKGMDLRRLPCGARLRRQCCEEHSPPGTSGACRRKLHPDPLALDGEDAHGFDVLKANPLVDATKLAVIGY